ncbi:MAG: 1-(5-phosphoribosyl)-5-((5-phosphoribosylamino)methylideneamino)imidazole-4-carboxamide isomerase, partial [Nitrospirae bacterium]
KNIDVPIEVGGGIRDIQTIRELLNIGVDTVILGTVIVENIELFKEACAKFPGRIAAAIDAKAGKVSIKGWVEDTEEDAFLLAKDIEKYGASAVIYTDISRDGMLIGPNISATKKMVDILNIPVIASGGVSSLKDIKALSEIKGLYGVITGKAIYSGAISLKDALEIVKRD